MLPDEECRDFGDDCRSRGKILIVEDEFLVALQLEDILIDAGYDVVGTVSDREGLSAVDETPDLALVDLNLRDGLSGPSIAREVAQAFGAKVVYVTANPDQIDEPALTAIGIVQKPFTRDAILATLQYALSGAGACDPPADLVPLYMSRNGGFRNSGSSGGNPLGSA